MFAQALFFNHWILTQVWEAGPGFPSKTFLIWKKLICWNCSGVRPNVWVLIGSPRRREIIHCICRNREMWSWWWLLEFVLWGNDAVNSSSLKMIFYSGPMGKENIPSAAASSEDAEAVPWRAQSCSRLPLAGWLCGDHHSPISSTCQLKQLAFTLFYWGVKKRLKLQQAIPRAVWSPGSIPPKRVRDKQSAETEIMKSSPRSDFHAWKSQASR